MAEQSLNSYYQGVSLVGNIPLEQRLYDRPTALLTRIEEGRAPMMRMLLNTARSQGGYIANDVKSYWGIEEKRKIRMAITADSDDSGATANTNDVFWVSNAEATRIQAGDLMFVDGTYTNPGRTLSPVSVKSAAATAADMAAMPEVVKVVTVYGAGATDTSIKVIRNHGGTATTGAGLLLDVSAHDYNLVKMTNSLAEGLDDMQLYSDTDDEDYNYAQIVGRKWGATQTEENVKRAYTAESTFARNGRRMLGEFWDETEFLALLGARKAPEIIGGRKKWFTGGLMEFIPESNWKMYSPSLFSPTEFNTQTKDMFYYGSQTKIAVCGADFLNSMSNMFSSGDSNFYALPAEKNSWGVQMKEFTSSNGGTIYFVASDLLSLYGMGDVALIYDPAHFQYGHLNNMNIDTYVHSLENPHEKTAEIYGQILFKRTNPKAHWAFRLGT